MAMFVREGVAGQPVTYWAGANADKRPLMSKRLDDWNVYNIHAGGVEYIADALKIAMKSTRWAVVGDFNQDPKTVRGILTNPSEHVVAPHTPTRPASGRTIDFAVSSRAGSAQTGPKYDGSDHLSVAIDLG